MRLPIKKLLTSQRNQIYSEASSTHFSAINLSYFTLYSSKCSLFQIHHYISENIHSYRRTQFNLTLCDKPIKTLLTSQRNQIYSEASSTHFSANNLSYFTLYSSKCSLFQIHHYIPENYQTYRGTQFNLTLSITIKTLLASQRNQIYSEASSTHFSAINLSYFTLYSSKCSLFQIHHYISENIQSYRRTQFNLTLCDKPIKTLLTSQRNQIYSEASSTHFSANNLSYFTLYSSKCSLFQIHHYIPENYQTYRGTQFNLTLSITNQNTSRLSTQSNIFWSIFNTLFSY